MMTFYSVYKNTFSYARAKAFCSLFSAFITQTRYYAVNGTQKDHH